MTLNLNYSSRIKKRLKGPGQKKKGKVWRQRLEGWWKFHSRNPKRGERGERRERRRSRGPRGEVQLPARIPAGGEGRGGEVVAGRNGSFGAGQL